MSMRAKRSGFSALLLGLLLVAAAAPAPRTEGPLRGYPPEDNAAPGWTRDGGPQEYEGEDLYTYIDGGADIYHEYGFRRVIVQDYKNAGGRSVSLEIFEMTTPAAAFGMFSFKRSGKGKSLELGGGAELEDYYLNFWTGRFLVTLTGFDEAAETKAGLKALAGVVDSKMKDRGDAPRLIRILPEGGLVPGSVKYLKGIIGLNNTYDLYTARGLKFAEAVKGDYGDGSTLIVLRYGPGAGEGAAPSFLELSEYLGKSERFKRVGADMVFQDGKGRFVSFSSRPPDIFIGIGADAETAQKRVQSAMPVIR